MSTVGFKKRNPPLAPAIDGAFIYYGPDKRIYVIKDDGTIKSLEDTDVLVSVSPNDTGSGYLFDKITASNGLLKTIVNPGGNEILDISIIDTAVFQTHQRVPVTNISNAGKVLTFGPATFVRVPASIGYDQANGIITLTKSAPYHIFANFTGDTDSGSRQGGVLTMEMEIGGNFVEVPAALGPSEGRSYHRNYPAGEGQSFINAIYPPFNAGTRIRFVVRCINNSTISSVPQGCSLTIKEV